MKKDKYHWVCDECKKDGYYEVYDFENVVLRCPYCRGLDISTTKLNIIGCDRK